MGDYTRLDIRQAREILKIYRQKELNELIPLSLGISNSNYKVIMDDGEQLLLKVSNDKNQSQLQSEQEILSLLADLKYPYSLRSLNTSDGSSIYTYGEFFGVIYPFIEGIPPGPSDVTCAEIGKALAKLHLLKFDPSVHQARSHEDVGYGPSKIKEYIHSSKAQAYFVESFKRVFPNGVDHLADANLPSGIIHGDLYYDNTLFQNESIAAVLDFEQAGIGEYLLDLGISISGTCLEKGLLHDGLIKSYLKGYEEIRPLKPLEKENLIDGICLGLFSIALWRIKRFTEGGLNPVLKDSYKDLLNKAIAFKEETIHE
ncbi:MAG: hypothetical protein COW01_10410 [Bdellovibrionales bacterium CG12_big_fil_rev_8_21_14_0_65_38_15]|nr:MAG: hypothetical protein COW79_07255 [Bdellovibrionales bacterium CG22_combo_CG10-13_8_21_14_all_38_13]PIQ54549.1 MAG: hypothetical protein COW01_10410 [Bdellovibrionales bacterium CG12_big_fil_rev_8_21_14_0_65_38_15]PIR29930.1 MAG: hypothetical protein COV38_08255 [Bdellovibrionales bacterium CG11_big_fil_rev_8_21_14_0_20_38_13]